MFSLEPEIDIREQSPIALAFVGDGVFELLVRARLVSTTRLVPHSLHAQAVRLVSAKGQAVAAEALLPLLSEEEQAVLRRGKNASKATVSKHATPAQYRTSTGLEALFGWLYLQRRGQRIETLFDAAWNAVYAERPASPPAAEKAPETAAGA